MSAKFEAVPNPKKGGKKLKDKRACIQQAFFVNWQQLIHTHAVHLLPVQPAIFSMFSKIHFPNEMPKEVKEFANLLQKGKQQQGHQRNASPREQQKSKRGATFLFKKALDGSSLFYLHY